MIAAAVVVTAATTLILARYWPFGLLRLSKRRHKVRLHIDKGPSIEGILLGRSKGEYVLDAARVFQDNETSHEAGRVSVPITRTLFYQVIDS